MCHHSCQELFKGLTLWDPADLGPSRCRSPCRTPRQWSSPLPAVLSAFVQTKRCRVEESDPAGLPNPSLCRTFPSLVITHNIRGNSHIYMLEWNSLTDTVTYVRVWANRHQNQLKSVNNTITLIAMFFFLIRILLLSHSPPTADL